MAGDRLAKRGEREIQPIALPGLVQGAGRAAQMTRKVGEELARPVYPGARLVRRTIAAFVRPSAVVPIVRGIAPIGAASLAVIGIVLRIVRLAEVVGARSDILLRPIARAAARVVGIVV